MLLRYPILCILVSFLLPMAKAGDLHEKDWQLLVRLKVTEPVDYWKTNAVAGGLCDGGKTAELIQRMAGVFEPVRDFPGALEALKQRKIIWNDYWEKNAVTGGRCQGEYVGNLLRAAASQLADAELLRKFGSAPGLLPSPEPSAFILPGTVKHRTNLIIGTQTFQPAYQFTNESRLTETAQAILALGCSVIKFEISPRYAERSGNVPGKLDSVHSLTELVRDEPSHRKVMEMPFTHYVLWAHTFAGGERKWRSGFSQDAAAAEYREIYELTTYLLKTYRGTGKLFYLGHWEGDGWLRGTTAPENDAKVTDAAAQGMADWLNTRQRAVDDARRDTAPEGVQLWHYTEVNHVKLAMQGRPALVNRVLPKTTVDLVSYSSYDTQADPPMLKAALNFIEAQLPPKPGIRGRRVFIGEYGFPRIHHTPETQNRLSTDVMRAGIEWGCPLILYWALYNNETDSDGRQRGFWLIDDKGEKQPVYETHRRTLDQARRFYETWRGTGPVPYNDFRVELLRILSSP